MLQALRQRAMRNSSVASKVKRICNVEVTCDVVTCNVEVICNDVDVICNVEVICNVAVQRNVWPLLCAALSFCHAQERYSRSSLRH